MIGKKKVREGRWKQESECTEMKEWALPTLETQNRASTSLTKSILVVKTPVPSLKGIWVWAGALWDVGTDTEGDVGGGTKPGGLPEEGHSR